jgi:hypothetical protein
MTFTVLIFSYRKVGITPAEFRAQAGFDYDAISKLSFTDQAAFAPFIALMGQPNNAVRMKQRARLWIRERPGFRQ